MRIVMFSDTHSKHYKIIIPKGDMLIFAGDGEFRDLVEYKEFLDWFEQQPHKYKILIAGNHDFYLEDETHLLETFSRDIYYLENSGINIEGFNIWGSPITPEFNNWAFMAKRGDEISQYWDLIPKNTDILITHGPPMCTLDMTMRGEPVGCWDLSDIVKRIKPKLHVFGHIHSCQGIVEKNGTIYVNASILNEHYQIEYEPKVVELKNEEL